MVFNTEQPCLEMGFVFELTFFFLNQFFSPYPSEAALGPCFAELSEQSVSYMFADTQSH